ncbi:hypothetical protein Q5P01_008552 [Channa striata]|uniref:Uncharacterized protein n=1 Tax=Channa striata TaxID=64152 RepID=A0AA88SU56_CHASR|nr:hypothetical protein Q5P01_008552 [Channa striata]
MLLCPADTHLSRITWEDAAEFGCRRIKRMHPDGEALTQKKMEIHQGPSRPPLPPPHFSRRGGGGDFWIFVVEYFMLFSPCCSLCYVIAQSSSTKWVQVCLKPYFRVCRPTKLQNIFSKHPLPLAAVGSVHFAFGFSSEKTVTISPELVLREESLEAITVLQSRAAVLLCNTAGI